jgi:hypothetical protein
MIDKTKLAGTTLAAIAACVLVAGCNGSSSKSASSSATPAATTQAAVAAAGNASQSAADGGQTATPTGATAATKVTCSQLTYADVQPLMVDKITGVKVIPAGQNGEGQTCNWASEGSSDSMSITVLSGQDATDTYAADVQSTSKPVSVPGVGDKAVRDGGDGTSSVSALKGSTYCRVAPGDGEVPGIANLEKAAGDSSNIGDANYALESAAAATLCNRVFGSGNTTPDLTALMAAGSAAATASPSDQDTLPSNFAIPTDGASSS